MQGCGRLRANTRGRARVAEAGVAWGRLARPQGGAEQTLTFSVCLSVFTAVTGDREPGKRKSAGGGREGSLGRCRADREPRSLRRSALGCLSQKVERSTPQGRSEATVGFPRGPAGAGLGLVRAMCLFSEQVSPSEFPESAELVGGAGLPGSPMAQLRVTCASGPAAASPKGRVLTLGRVWPLLL